ncbi:MAG: oligosaccharide flippase family protein [Bacteroidales bacterium]|nr:oligosaccharide flippase family protein [Bacteroidales bacterium]
MAASQIQKGAIISYVSIFLNIAITFFYTPWMIRQIGVSDYGLYSLTTTFISYFILDFGLSGTIQRFIAKYRAEGRKDKIENMLGLTTKVYLSIDTIIFLVLFVLYFFLQNIFVGLTAVEVETLKRLYVIAGLFSVLTFVMHPMNGAMMAYEYFVETKLLDMVQKVGTVLFIVLVLLLNGSVYELVLITGLTGWLVSLSKYFVFRRKSRVNIHWRYFNRSEMRMLLAFSMWVFLIGLAQRFRLTIMPSVLGITANSTEISIFSLGMTIEAMFFTISSALNGLFLPKVTRLTYQQDRKAINALMVRVGRVQLYVISFILFTFFLVGREFLSLWVGELFERSYYIVLLLTGTNIVSLTQHIGVDIVYAENKVRYTSALTFSTAILGLLLAVFLSHLYGALGCAIAVFCSLFTYLILVNRFYARSLNIDIKGFFQQCHLRVLPYPIVITILFWIVKTVLPIHSWAGIIFFSVFYAVVFFSIVFLFVLNKEEKGMIRSIIHH